MLSGEEVAAGKAVMRAVQAHRHYRAGFLQESGGTAGQPPLLMDSILVVANAVADHEAAEIAEQEAKARQPSSGGPKDGGAMRLPDKLPGRPGFRKGWRQHARRGRR